MAPIPAPRGVFAAVLTPLTGDLEPDLKAFAAHARWLLANGCDGLAPLGTTGEANSLSLGQSMKSSRRWRRRCRWGNASSARAPARWPTR